MADIHDIPESARDLEDELARLEEWLSRFVQLQATVQQKSQEAIGVSQRVSFLRGIQAGSSAAEKD